MLIAVAKNTHVELLWLDSKINCLSDFLQQFNKNYIDNICPSWKNLFAITLQSLFVSTLSQLATLLSSQLRLAYYWTGIADNKQQLAYTSFLQSILASTYGQLQQNCQNNGRRAELQIFRLSIKAKFFIKLYCLTFHYFELITLTRECFYNCSKGRDLAFSLRATTSHFSI